MEQCKTGLCQNLNFVLLNWLVLHNNHFQIWAMASASQTKWLWEMRKSLSWH